MSKISELIKSPHVHLAFVTGCSIIVLAYFSKRVLPDPIPYLQLAIPPFVMTIWEALLGKHKEKKFMTSWYWMMAIILLTTTVILINMN